MHRIAKRTEKAVVTGAFGFVGRHVARRLANDGIQVVGIGHGQWGRAEWQQWGLSEWHASDVNLAAMATYAGQPDLIVHCAGSGSVAFSMAQPYLDYERSVNSTMAVLEFMRITAPEACLVLPSSAGVYGRAESHPISVTARRHPMSPYGFHKMLAEQVCQSYGLHFGIRSAIVRLFSVYGIGLRKQLLWDACNKISRNDLLFFGIGNETRDWIHVDDAACLIQIAAERATTDCFITNGGAGHGSPIKEVLDLIAEQFSAGPILFNGMTRPGDPTHYEADISEALALGWRPERQWRKEVAAYVQWFQEGAP